MLLFDDVCSKYVLMLGTLQTLVLDGARDESNGTFTGKGYTSLAIIYSAMAVCNWIAPSVVAFFGAKWSMLIGAILYW